MALGVALLALAAAQTVQIAPGVTMPLVNLGGSGDPSNYSLWTPLGGRGFDTALAYGAETESRLGAALQQIKDVRREDIFVTTKVPCCPAPDDGGFGSHICKTLHRGSAEADANATLATLGLEYADLILLHFPCATMDATLKAYAELELVAQRGQARALGVSNFDAAALDALVPNVKTKPVVNQCAYSVGNHEKSGSDDATIAKCRELGLTYFAYSPLGHHGDRVDVLRNPDVQSIAAAHNRSAAQVALRWVVQQGHGVVTASMNAQHLAGDLAIFDFELTDAEMERLAKVGSTATVVV